MTQSMAAKAIAKQWAITLIGVVMILLLWQPALQAATTNPATSEQAFSGYKTTTTQSLEQKRAQRREMQSKASEAADTEKEAGSVKGTLIEKLNLDEIVEENVIVDNLQNAFEQ